MSVILSTKAGTLETLQGRLESAQILPLVYFTREDWLSQRKSCLQKVSDKFGKAKVIVRSSFQDEDQESSSKAGKYLSLLDVGPQQASEAIDRVFSESNRDNGQDQVLIQPMLERVSRSGVAFSHDPNTCAPYRVINWSEGSDTTHVTGGRGGRIWQTAAESKTKAPPEIQTVLTVVEELQNLFENIPLDIEFAFANNSKGSEEIWLLQVRPLITNRTCESVKEQSQRLGMIHQKISRGMGEHPFLLGKRTAYGVMPDWNPAEIIGIRPKPLALSLYRELITDSIWAYQRHNYGYRNLRSVPLMQDFFGLPYIDVRVSFNSFIPADLNEPLASRLVDYYVESLLAEPNLHDKVEFAIVFSCYTLDLTERLQNLDHYGFSKSDQENIAISLRELTNRIVNPKNGLWLRDVVRLDSLNDRHRQIISSDADLLEKIYWLLEDTKRYGTLPFAGLARAGFLSVQMLQSLVSTDILSRKDYDAFLSSINSVGTKLAYDREHQSRTAFLSHYGHLRPGTYDILSPRYDEAPDLYFDWSSKSDSAVMTEPFSITLPQMRKIGRALESHGLNMEPVELFDFMQAGIEQRELAKFQFTRNLSDALVLISDYGSELGFSKDDLAYCDISIFKELHISAIDPYETLAKNIDLGRSRYAQTLATALPPIISDPNDAWAFEWPESSPNFVTQLDVIAPVAGSNDPLKVAHAIICIPNADPGFDWLFTHPIAGLITAWGGVNSHMAIRASELGIPAVIGAGEQLYNIWSSAKRLRIDCAGQRVEIIE